MSIQEFCEVSFGYEGNIATSMRLLFSTDSKLRAWFLSPLALNCNIKSKLNVTE